MISHNENTIKKAKKNDGKSTGASVEQPENEINLLQEIFGMVKDPQKRISGINQSQPAFAIRTYIIYTIKVTYRISCSCKQATL